MYQPTCRFASLLVLLLLVSSSSVASAQSVETEDADEAHQEVAWSPKWPRVRTWEYVAAPALTLTGLTFRFIGPEQLNTWRGEIIPGEHEAMHLISMETVSARDNAQLISELTFYGPMAYRFVDSVLIPGLYYDNWDLALQMSVIDLQSFGLVGTVLWGTHIFVGRERPAVSHCAEDDPRPSAMCEPDSSERYRSFIAGHPATSITAAGLTCLHHSRMPLYGGGLADDLACASMIGVAGVTTVTRMMVEFHYPSDVVMGVALGTFSGWVLPSLLHYGFGDDEEQEEVVSASSAEEGGWRPGKVLLQVSPIVDEEGGGLQLRGRF